MNMDLQIEDKNIIYYKNEKLEMNLTEDLEKELSKKIETCDERIALRYMLAIFINICR